MNKVLLKDELYKKGIGSGLLLRKNNMKQIIKGMSRMLSCPLSVKLRTGVSTGKNIAHKLIPNLFQWGVNFVTMHGRTREQRYTKAADWEYIKECTIFDHVDSPRPIIGNGDILSWEDVVIHENCGISGFMIGRGALMKPWIFTEIKEKRHWDVSSSERFEMLRRFTNYGLTYWGSDFNGVERTRYFLLEWLSFLCRYVPVGLLERTPQRMNERPPRYFGRDELETLMASQRSSDWIKISELLLGHVPSNFRFEPKHKAHSY
jgi:tRNA-dihydrouridine synthase 3